MENRTRAEEFGQYILDNNATIRKTAKFYDISKSTVHNDVSKRLKFDNVKMYYQVKKVLEYNFKVKHLRGGLATKSKFMICKNKKDD